MTDKPAPCRTTRHCADHGFCHRCVPSLDEAVRHLVLAIDAAGITSGSGRVYAQLAATIRDAARQAAGQPAAAVTGATATCRYCGHGITYEPLFRDGREPNENVWSHTGSGSARCSTRPVGWAAEQWPFATPASRDTEPAAGQPATQQQAGEEARPADHSWFVGKRGEGCWFVASIHYSTREKALKRLAKRREEFPDDEFAIVRETATWTVEETH